MELLDVYNAIARGEHLPNMQRGGFDVQSETFTDPGLLWIRLLDLSPTEGWLLFQSHQTIFQGGLPIPEQDWGVLLAGETVDADGTSFALEQDGAGGWMLSRYSHQTNGDMLVDEQVLLPHNPAARELRYQRYWRDDAEQGYVQTAACFIGLK